MTTPSLTFTEPAGDGGPEPDPPRRQTLFDLTQEALEIMDRIEQLYDETGGEATEEVEALLDADLQNREELERKLQNYCWVLREKEGQVKRYLSDASVYRDVVESLEKQAARAQKEHDKLHERIHHALNVLGVKELQAGPFPIKVVGKGGSHPVEMIESDPTKLPERFQRRKVALTFIRAQLLMDELDQLNCWIHRNKRDVSAKDVIEADKVGIAQALKDGDEEAAAIARLGELGTVLKIG